MFGDSGFPPRSLSFKMEFRGVVPPPKKRAKAAALHAAAVGGTSPGGGDDDDDDSPAWHPNDDGPAWHAEFDLSPRADQLPGGEAAKATRVSGELKSRAISHVVWWNTVALNPHADDMYPLSSLIFAHDTGVHGFHIPAGCCTTMTSFLDNQQNYSAQGWLLMAGRQFPGYSRYPYVHSPLGQLATIQEVSAHHLARGSWQSPLMVCTPPLFVPVPQRKTVRVSGKTMCDFVLARQPEVRQFVDAVRVALRLPDTRRNPEASTPPQPKGKCIRAMHLLLQDESQQASFSWHDDASDIGHEGVHMTTVIVSLSNVPSCMRMWGFQPFLFEGAGAACAFAGAATHESVPRKSAGAPVRKVALFFA